MHPNPPPAWRVADRLGDVLRQRRRFRNRERIHSTVSVRPTLERTQRLLRQLNAAERRGFAGACCRLERRVERALYELQSALHGSLHATAFTARSMAISSTPTRCSTSCIRSTTTTMDTP